MPPLRLPLRREWVGERGKIDPVALAAVEDSLDDVWGEQRHAQDAGQVAHADPFLLRQFGHA